MTNSQGSGQKRRRLGRGLGSLISTPVAVETKPATTELQEPGSTAGAISPPLRDVHHAAAYRAPETMGRPATDAIVQIPLDSISPNPRQPRQAFDAEALASLTDSIRTAGVMQPILVRRDPDRAERYQLIAGERRWRAARNVPLQSIPAVVRDVDDQAAAEWALVENLQREDLNPIERADAFRELIEQFGLTHQEMAERVGLDRSTISNHLRLHDLDRQLQDWVRDGSLSLGHAKALLAIANNSERQRLAEASIEAGWSVRELERRAATSATPTPQTAQKLSASTVPAKSHLDDLERRLGEHLGTRVHIRTGRKKGAGRLIIEFVSLDEFDGLMRRLDFNDEA